MKLVHHSVLTDDFAVQDHLPKIVIMGLLVQGGWLVHFNLLLDKYENSLISCMDNSLSCFNDKNSNPVNIKEMFQKKFLNYRP